MHPAGEGCNMERLKRFVSPLPPNPLYCSSVGVPLFVEAFDSLGLPAQVREDFRIRQRDRGFNEAAMVESFVILNAVGGECGDNFKRLRADAGFGEMIGHGVSSSSGGAVGVAAVPRRSEN